MGIIKKTIGSVTRLFLRQFGKTINDIPAGIDRKDYHFEAIINLNPDAVLDIGANEGQFAIELRKAGFKNNIISFEPQKPSFEKLKEKAAGDDKWKVYNIAFGGKKSTEKMHISNFSPSSSLLPIGELHISLMPHTFETEVVDIDMEVLDEWWTSNGPNYSRVFIKIDVQGYEGVVLSNGLMTLNSAIGVIAELNFADLFCGQTKYFEVFKILSESNFEFIGLYDIHRNPEDFRLLWADGLFIKSTGGPTN